MAFIQIKPAISTNIVRHPNNMRILKPEGEEVEHNSYWERRLKDGDVLLVESKDLINQVPTIADDNNVKKSKNKIEDNN